MTFHCTENLQSRVRIKTEPSTLQSVKLTTWFSMWLNINKNDKKQLFLDKIVKKKKSTFFGFVSLPAVNWKD